MALPKFEDLGKEARDLANKNFHFGVVKFETSMVTGNGVKFTTDGTHNTDTGNVAGALEGKVTLPAYGLTLKKKWNTDNVIAATVSVEDKLAKGLKLDLDTTFAPVTGKKSLKVKSAYTNGNVHATADVDCDIAGPTVHLSGMLGAFPRPVPAGLSIGCQASYDTANSKLVGKNIGGTYKDGDFILHSGIYDSSRFVGSIHHQVNDKLSAGALLNWTSGSSQSSITFCGKYAWDDNTFVKAKIDNQLHLGVSYVQKLRDGVNLTLSGLVNGKAVDQGGHKIGLSVNFDA